MPSLVILEVGRFGNLKLAAFYQASDSQVCDILNPGTSPSPGHHGSEGGVQDRFYLQGNQYFQSFFQISCQGHLQ